MVEVTHKNLKNGTENIFNSLLGRDEFAINYLVAALTLTPRFTGNYCAVFKFPG